MMVGLIETGEPGLAKDQDSGAVLNTDVAAYKRHRRD
jgi:hypothetical protein